MSTIRAVPHLDTYVAEPRFCLLSYGHRVQDTAAKMWSLGTVTADDNGYQFSSRFSVSGRKPNLRFFEFAGVLSLDADQNPVDNILLQGDDTPGADDITWNPIVGSWIEAVPSYQNTSAIHFQNASADSYGRVQTGFNVPANCSFIIPIYRYGIPVGADIENYPGIFIITFGGYWKIILYNTGQPPELLKWDGEDFTLVSKGPTNLFSVNSQDYLTVTIIDRYIVISNGVEDATVSSWKYYDRSPTFVTQSYSESRSETIQKPIVTISSPITIEIQNQAGVFSFWYLKHQTTATILSQSFQTDQYYRLTPLLDSVNAIVDLEFRVPAGQGGDCFGTTSGVGNNGIRYQVTISSGDDRFSPLLASATLQIGPDRQPIFRSRRLTIPSEHVEALSLNSNVQTTTGNITLNNYGGTYRNVTGVHGLAIDVGWHYANEQTLSPAPVARNYGVNLYRKFTGYFKKSDRSRNSPVDSKMSFPLVSRQIQAEDAIAVNLPIFDGVCEIHSFLEIFYRCGCLDAPSDPVRVYNPTTGQTSTVFTTPGILAWQNPWNGSYQTLRGYWSATGYDPGTSRACRLGLCNHSILPSGGWSDPPKYKFEFGTSLWSVANQLREWSLPWMFYNNWGNCIIFYNNRPDLRRIMYNWFYQPIGTFREIPSSTPFEVLGYNEYHALNVSLDTDTVRNAILAMGLDERELSPILSVLKNDLRNGDAFNYIPWYKWVNPIPRSPFWSTPEHVARIALNLFLRVRRPHPQVSLRSWGQPAVFPYTMLELLEGTFEAGTSRETFPDELIRTSRLFRVTDHNESFNFRDKTYSSDIQVEWQDIISQFFFDPTF